MIDKLLIKSKLSEMQGYYEELCPILDMETKDIVRDAVRLHALERLFQLIVDTALDINSHIIARSDIPSPEDFQSTFITLGVNSMLQREFAEKIAPSVGLRNKIIHKYGEVDIKQLVDAVKNEIGDYLEYIKQIERFINDSADKK